MVTIEKHLLKLHDKIENFKSEKLSFKVDQLTSNSSLYCLEVLITNKESNSEKFACTLFFDCNKKIIYLDDYNTIFGSQKQISKNTLELFKQSLTIIKDILTDHPSLDFKTIQTTTRIPDKFDLLKNIGFKQMEQLNHYGNTKFVLEL